MFLAVRISTHGHVVTLSETFWVFLTKCLKKVSIMFCVVGSNDKLPLVCIKNVDSPAGSTTSFKNNEIPDANSGCFWTWSDQQTFDFCRHNHQLQVLTCKTDNHNK